jgi:Protein of unknown function (DUF1559)
MPTYTGIAGCMAIAPGDGGVDNPATVVNGIAGAYGLGPDPTTGAAKAADSRIQYTQMGYIGGNGSLIPGKANNLAGLADGTSNTMLVGEQSGWQYYGGTQTAGTPLPGKQSDFRASAIFGAYVGANYNGTPPNFAPAGAGGATNVQVASAALTLTTVRFPINAFTTRLASGANSGGGSYPWIPLLTQTTSDTIQYGVCGTTGGTAGSTPPTIASGGSSGTACVGANNPIQSQHPAGALVLMGDGSAKMLKNETDIVVLKRYACRDDRLVISDNVN